MSDRDRFIDILAREIALSGHTADANGNPPDDAWMRDFYGENWIALFRPAAISAVMKAEAAGFSIVGPDDGR